MKIEINLSAHEFGTRLNELRAANLGALGLNGVTMNGRANIDDQIRDLAERNRDLEAINRHHQKRMRWLILQMSDEELKRLGLDEPNRNADDWSERVMRKLDAKLDRFMKAHGRLVGVPLSTRTRNFLDRFQADISDQLRQEVKRAARAALAKINSGMRK